MITHGSVKFVPSGMIVNDPNSKPSWVVKATPNVMMRLRRIFPRASFRARTLWLTDTPELARDLQMVVGRWPMEIDPASQAHLEGRVSEHIATEEEAVRILEGGSLELPAGAYEPAREPRDYQRIASDLFLSLDRLLLADELGLGKSFTSLLALRDPGALPALVVCQAHLPKQWLGELAKSFPLLTGHIVKRNQPYDVTQHGAEPDVLFITYSKLASWADHLAGRIKTVIFDEVQELRRAESQKYRAAEAIALEAERVTGLTATPVYNYGGEIYNIMRIIEPDAFGTREEFVNEWGAMMSGGKVGVKDPRALGHFLRAEHLMVRRTRKEVGRELPDVIRVPHTIDVDPKALETVRSSVRALAEAVLAADTDRTDRFRAAGDLDYTMRKATGEAKAPFVAQFVRMIVEAGEPVVLFGWHHDVYRQWVEDLEDLDPAFYTGKQSPTQKEESKRRFLEGETDVLVMSLRSGAGLDGLQERASIAVFGELDWSPGMHDQCIGRLNRDGQEEPVTAYFLICEEGSDPIVADVLNLKRSQSDPIREPDAALLTEAPKAADRIKLLAREVLGESAASPELERQEVLV